MNELTDAEFLRDLINRLRQLPATQSTDCYDFERLERIAKELEENQFILHWLDGKTEVIVGNGIKDAFNRAGLGAGAISALDYYEMVTA